MSKQPITLTHLNHDSFQTIMANPDVVVVGVEIYTNRIVTKHYELPVDFTYTDTYQFFEAASLDKTLRKIGFRIYKQEELDRLRNK